LTRNRLQHLKKEEVDTLVQPHADTVEAVEAWLDDHGVPKDACSRNDAGNWLSVTLSVEQAERMLGMFLCVSTCHPTDPLFV
jgi:tripeptidyl-peptidase-1